VVLDMEMPGQTGYEVYWSLRAAHPGLPLLIWSGTDSALVRERLHATAPAGGVAACPDFEIMEKPVHLRDIASALRRLLHPVKPGQVLSA
jgi:CheY-like chemotaxis protein